MERSYPKRRKYAHHASYSPHQNGGSRTYTPAVHHGPRRFHSPENKRSRPRNYNIPDMCNGDSAVLPFYQHSSKYQRTKKEKHRQSSQPYWSDKPDHELNDVSHFSANSLIPNSSKHPYSLGQTKEPYWADTVGRKADYTSPKLIHVSEKRPTRQTKEPYWMESFEHYEVESLEENLQPTQGSAPTPMVHRERPTPAPQHECSLSYRFPNQDPQYLKKCVLSLKRKLKDAATATSDSKTSESSDSLSSENIKDNKEENTQVSEKSACEKKSRQALSSSIVDQFESYPEKGDMALDVHGKKETSDPDQQSKNKKELVSTEPLSQEVPDQSLVSEVENAKDKVVKVRITKSSSSDAKDNNVDTESEAESEVFDDIFFQTIRKEIDELGENDVYLSEEKKKDKPSEAKDSAQIDDHMDTDFDDDPSRSEGSISPTFDSTLLRYLDDNIRSRVKDVDKTMKKVSDQVLVNAEENIKEKSGDLIELEDDETSRRTCDKTTNDLNEKDSSDVKSEREVNSNLRHIESENSQECVDDLEKNNTTTKSSHQQIDIIEENNDIPVAMTSQGAVNEDKNDSAPPAPTSEISERVEKSAETFLEFNNDSPSSTVQECSNTKVSVDVSMDDMQTSVDQGIPEASETTESHNLTVERIGKSSQETANNSGIEHNHCTALFDKNSSQTLERKDDTFSKNSKAEIISTEQAHVNVNEGIRLIREKCKSSTTVKHVESVIDKATELEEEITTNEVSKTCELNDGKRDSHEIPNDTKKESSSEDCGCIEDSHSAFVPLSEDLLFSVRKELERKEEENHEHDDTCCTDNTFPAEDAKTDENNSEEVSLNSESTTNASCDTTEDTSAYNILHSVVLASKMISEYVSLEKPFKIPTSNITVTNALDLPSDSVPITKAIELVKGNMTDPEICSATTNMQDSKTPTEMAVAAQSEVSTIDSTRYSISKDKNIAGNKESIVKDLCNELHNGFDLKKEILVPKTLTEPLVNEEDGKNVESLVSTSEMNKTQRTAADSLTVLANGWETQGMGSEDLENLKVVQNTACRSQELFNANDFENSMVAKTASDIIKGSMRDLVSSPHSKEIEVDDPNLDTLDKTASIDLTPPMGEDFEKNKDCSNSPALTNLAVTKEMNNAERKSISVDNHNKAQVSSKESSKVVQNTDTVVFNAEDIENPLVSKTASGITLSKPVKGSEVSENSGTEEQDFNESTELKRVMTEQCPSSPKKKTGEKFDVSISEEMDGKGGKSVTKDLLTFDVKKTLKVSLFAPQAKQRDLDSKEMEVGDPNLDTLDQTASHMDPTPPVHLGKNEECSNLCDEKTSPTNMVEDKTPEISESQKNIAVLDSKNSEPNTTDPVGHSNTDDAKVFPIEGETSLEKEDVKNAGDEHRDDQASKSGKEVVLLQDQVKSCLAERKTLKQQDENPSVVEDTVILVEKKRKEKLTYSKKKKVENGHLICSKSKDLAVCDELNKDKKEDDEKIAALYKYLDSNQNDSSMYLLNTLKKVKCLDVSSSSPIVRSLSQDSNTTDSEHAYLDTLILEAGKLSDVDTSSRESSDAEMEDPTRLSKKQKDEKRDPVSNNAKTDPVIQSNVIVNYGLTKNHIVVQEPCKSSKQSPKTKTLLRSTLEREGTHSSRDSQGVSLRISSKERKQFVEKTKDILTNIKELSRNTTERFKDNKEPPENVEAEGSENNAFLCKNNAVHPKESKEFSRSNKDISKNTVTARRKGRPSRQSLLQKAEVQIDASPGKLKRRSPRQQKKIHDKSLSSRQIPYYREKSGRFDVQFLSNKGVDRLKDLIRIERDVKAVDGTLEIDEEQPIDIMEIDDVDEFHLELDASEEESPKKVGNLQTSSSSEKIVSKKYLDDSLTEHMDNSLGCGIKPNEEVNVTNKLIDNSNTPDGTMVKECSTTEPVNTSCQSHSSSGSTIASDSCKAVDGTNLLVASPTLSCSTAHDKSATSWTNKRTGRRRGRRKFSRKRNPVGKTRRLSSSPVTQHVSKVVCANENTAKVPSRNDTRFTELDVCITTSGKERLDNTIGNDKSSLEKANINCLDSVSISSSEQSNASCSKVDTQGVFSSLDACSSNGSSSSLCMEDVRNQCPAEKEHGSTLTAMLETSRKTESTGRYNEGESLKITLISETNPDSGKMNWITGAGKPTEVKKYVSASYGLRPSKTRKMKNPSPTRIGQNAKRRRMTITDLRAGRKTPQKLFDLAKRPLEEYIKSVGKVLRCSDKNPEKGLLSIAMNDHISKTTLQDKEGDYLKLGDTDVMYEIVKKAYDESTLKRCRPSPRSLYFASKQGNTLQVLVLAAGCNVNATIPQEKHKTAMHAASAAGHVDVLRLLCMVGGNLSCLDTNLQSPLFDAVENQRTNVVKFLISQDVNLNLKDSQGMTVLHVAAQKSNVEIITLLLETRKMRVNEQDNGGWTALMWTAERMRGDVARCLLKWGANVNILDTEQNTCLHWAALAGDTQIMKLLLTSNVHIDARNMFGATALHISARERKLSNITTLAKYRPNVEIRNAEGKTAIELVPGNSRCFFELKKIEMLTNLANCTLKERLVSRDISRGQEKRPIPCVNEVDQDDLPHDFTYVSNNLQNHSQGFDCSMTSCNCTDGCVNDKLCECAQLSTRKRFWYDETGRINSEIFEEDRPLVYECNMKCKCWSNCHQRVVQHGITAGLQLYKTKEKGWAVRTQAFISKGTFVCEYVGEILTDNDADRRKDDCYLFDLDVKGQSTLFCLDAKFYGNITRFINHSCDPNILPVRVFTDHQLKSCPRIAFFAARDIEPYEEVCSNYGEKFWTVKKSKFYCLCNTSTCKYGPSKTH